MRPRTRHYSALLVATVVGLGLGSATLSPAHAAAPTWTAAGSLPDIGTAHIWSLAISPLKPEIALAGTDAGVYRSSDGGSSWKATSVHGMRAWAVGFDARDATIAYVGLGGQGIRRSLDSGATWNDASTGLTDRNVRCFAFGLGALAVGTPSGVFFSQDGTSWHSGGLTNSSISSLAVSANAPDFTVIAGVDSGDVKKGFLFRNTGGSAKWDVIKDNGLPPSTVVAALAAGPISESVTTRPLLVNTNSANASTYRSGDGGTTWTTSSGIPDQIVLTTSVFSPLDPNLVYASADAGGSSGGELLRSTDGGTSFAVASQGLPDQYHGAEAIAVAATTPPSLLAAVTTKTGQGLFRLVDSTAPAPPQIVAEVPGAPIPASLPTPVPTPTAKPAPAKSTTTNTNAGGFFSLPFFHFPLILLELALVILIVMTVARWRERYLNIEGPP